MDAPIVFMVFQKLSLPYTNKTFYLLPWNYCTYMLKMLTETFLIIPFSVIGRCSPASSPYWLQWKCAKLTCQRRLSGWFLQDHRRLPFCIFRYKNCCFRASEEGNWMIIKIYKLNFVLFTTMQQKIVKNHLCLYRKSLFNIIGFLTIHVVT